MIGHTIEHHLSAADPVQAHHHARQRGLAAPRRSHQRHAFAGADAETGIVHCPCRRLPPAEQPVLPIVPADIVDAQQRLGAKRHMGAWPSFDAAGLQQSPCIVRLWSGEHRFGVPALDQPAPLHHRHPGAQRPHCPDVVADEQQRHAPPLADLCNQIEHLALGDGVECRGRFIGDQQVRISGQRHGNHGALALPARQLVRITLRMHRQQTDLGQQARQLDLRAVRPRKTHAFGNLLANGHQRIERRHRLLEYHPHAPAAQPRHGQFVGR